MRIAFLFLFFFSIQQLSAQATDTISCDGNVYVPNFFSGNDDGIPQPFQVYFTDSLPSYFSFAIYNRWGVPVFASNNPNETWNGKYFNKGNVMEDGVYVYQLFYQWKNEKQLHNCNGKITCLDLRGIDASNTDTIPCGNVFVPNVLEVNSEILGRDYFMPVFACPPIDYNLIIYDRWGSIVFQTNDYQKGWDGSLNGNSMQMGEYVWRMKYVPQPNMQPKNLSGKLQLIR